VKHVNGTRRLIIGLAFAILMTTALVFLAGCHSGNY